MRKYIAFLFVGIILSFGYFGLWYYYMNQACQFVNNNYTNKDIFLPKKFFETRIWQQISKKEYSKAAKSLSSLASDFGFLEDKIEYFVNNTENYNFKFSKASFKGFPFKFELQLENFTENNIQSELNYAKPLHVGYDLLKGKFYINYNGLIIANFHPKSNGLVREITLDSEINLPFARSNLFAYDNFIQNFDKIQNINFIIKNLSVKENKATEPIFQASLITRSLVIYHQKAYNNFNDILNFGPKKYKLASSYEIEKADYTKELSSFSLMNFLTARDYTGKYQETVNYVTGAEDWSDLDKVLTNSDCSVDYVFHSPNKDSTNVAINLSLLNPEPDIYKLRYFINNDSKYSSKDFAKNFMIKLGNLYQSKTLLNKKLWPSLEAIFLKYYDDLPEKNDLKFNFDASVNVSKENIKVDIAALKLNINDIGFNVNNKTEINSQGFSSGGQMTINDTAVISKFLSDCVGFKFQFNDNEIVAFQEAMLKTMQELSGPQQSSLKDITTDYKITLFNQEFGGYSIYKIREMLKDNLLNSSKKNMKEDEFKKFMQKLPL